MESLGINLGYFLVHTFNFLIIMTVLAALAYKPILKALENRRQKITQSLEDARIAAEARANAEKEAEQILTEARANANRIVREATERAESASKDVKAAVEAEAVKAREAALAEAANERNRILADLRGQVAALSIAAAQKLIGQNLDEKRQHALLEEFFSGVKSGKVVMLEGTDVKGASAEITSALPLNKGEQETVKKDILSKLGKQATVTFRVDPAILGGLIIRVGDKLLDGSVAAQLEGLRHNLR